LFKISSEEAALSATERISALKSDFTSITLSIDNEIAEINVLEPQLAECKEDEKAYKNATTAKRKQNRTLEEDLLKARLVLAETEKRHKELYDKLESMRARLNKLAHLGIDDSSSSRRPIALSELPKVVSFMISDSKVNRDTEKEKALLESQLEASKHKLSTISKKIRELGGGNASIVATKPSKGLDFRKQGFVPIDGISAKRKREEEFLQEIENRKPTLANNATRSNSQSNPLQSLSLLVCYSLTARMKTTTTMSTTTWCLISQLVTFPLSTSRHHTRTTS